MKGAVAVIHGAAVAVGVEFNNTASILPNRDANIGCIRLSFPRAEAVAVAVLDLTGVRVAREISLALELSRGAPAVTLNGELAAIAGIVAGRMVVRIALVIDSLPCIIDNCEAAVMAILVATIGSGDR